MEKSKPFLIHLCGSYSIDNGQVLLVLCKCMLRSPEEFLAKAIRILQWKVGRGQPHIVTCPAGYSQLATAWDGNLMGEPVRFCQVNRYPSVRPPKHLRNSFYAIMLELTLIYFCSIQYSSLPLNVYLECISSLYVGKHTNPTLKLSQRIPPKQL